MWRSKYLYRMFPLVVFLVLLFTVLIERAVTDSVLINVGQMLRKY